MIPTRSRRRTSRLTASAPAPTVERRWRRRGRAKRPGSGATRSGERAEAAAGPARVSGPRRRAEESLRARPTRFDGPRRAGREEAAGRRGGSRFRRAKVAGERVARAGSERGRGRRRALAWRPGRARGSARRVTRLAAPATGADERRAALLAAAYATIADRGLDLRTREVAARAVSPRCTTTGSSGELVVAVIAYVRERSLRRRRRPGRRRRGGGPGSGGRRRALPRRSASGDAGAGVAEAATARTAFRSLHDFWAGMVEGPVARRGEPRHYWRAGAWARGDGVVRDGAMILGGERQGVRVRGGGRGVTRCWRRRSWRPFP